MKPVKVPFSYEVLLNANKDAQERTDSIKKK